MDLVQEINAFIAEKKKKLGLTELFVFESTNGFILASTCDGATMELESLGSLTSGALTALDMLSGLFSGGAAAFLAVETAEENLVFQRVEENYFLLAVAPKSIRIGYLQMKMERLAPELKGYVAQFVEASVMKISDIDIDEIQASLDSQFDDLFKEDK
jgi:predicted regulator of Ras-like GTPase activity (Roadblock/LC7/MglB family)